MAEHNDLGKEGEILAAAFLQEKGYQIVAKNWRFRKYELDIVAQKGNLLVVAEIKTRRTDYFGRPEVFVTRAKQKLLIEAANAYVEKNGTNLDIRFDILSVRYNSGKHEVHHIEDAFSVIG